jgi:hypothetical protein
MADLAVKAASSVDDLTSQWENAELSVVLLKTQATIFSAYLSTLSEWMEMDFLKSSASSGLNFVRNLAQSGEGCLRFLFALKLELDVIGHKPGKIRWRQKVMLLWNEEN